jgi:DNA polymerase III subunit gamma/tau
MSDTDTPAHEPDDLTPSMFAADPAPSGSAAKAGYQVLARKYRPTRFEDLIGQEGMVRTLTNAFATGRIAHAFMLTGVRGVGKTTTARLLARAFNFVADGRDAPSLQLDPPGRHCAEIMASRHPDVLELDAASRNGVADMRDLLDAVRYAPVAARYKVYIIDEVHMLTTQAFNALLKTLEEPPAHVKFIFATTEVRKVPVTVLSRCQRFDLRRLDAAGLARHLFNVCSAEGMAVSEEGLALISRAAEGSVRDALSLLDQALVQNQGVGEISGQIVRDMLGLADRGRVLDIFSHAISGNPKAALEEVHTQFAIGAEPATLVRDLMEVSADVARAQALGDDFSYAGPSDWRARLVEIGSAISPAQASRLWSILLKGHEDIQKAPDGLGALEMVVLRLVSAASLPSPEDAARLLAGQPANPMPAQGLSAARSDPSPALAEGSSQTARSSAPEAPAPERPRALANSGGRPVALAAQSPKSEIAVPQAQLDQIVGWVSATKDPAFLFAFERHVRPIALEPGKFSLALEGQPPRDLVRRLADTLANATGRDWRIDVRDDQEGELTLDARRRLARRSLIEEAQADANVARVLAVFDTAKVIEVKRKADERSTAGNVVHVDFKTPNLHDSAFDDDRDENPPPWRDEAFADPDETERDWELDQ